MQDCFPTEHVFTRELVARGKPPPESSVKSLSVFTYLQSESIVYRH